MSTIASDSKKSINGAKGTPPSTAARLVGGAVPAPRQQKRKRKDEQESNKDYARTEAGIESTLRRV